MAQTHGRRVQETAGPNRPLLSYANIHHSSYMSKNKYTQDASDLRVHATNWRWRTVKTLPPISLRRERVLSDSQIRGGKGLTSVIRWHPVAPHFFREHPRRDMSDGWTSGSIRSGLRSDKTRRTWYTRRKGTVCADLVTPSSSNQKNPAELSLASFYPSGGFKNMFHSS